MERVVQQVLSMESTNSSMRNKIVGWSCEDPSLFVQGKPIGHTGAARFDYHYDCVLQALAAGWKLLAPPTKISTHPHEAWEWWFVREVVVEL